MTLYTFILHAFNVSTHDFKRNRDTKPDRILYSASGEVHCTSSLALDVTTKQRERERESLFRLHADINRESAYGLHADINIDSGYRPHADINTERERERAPC